MSRALHTSTNLLAVFVLAAATTACGDNGSTKADTEPDAGPLAGKEGGIVDAGSVDETFFVDSSVAPPFHELRGFVGGERRPVAAVYDAALDVSTRFVENEIVVVTDDDDELDGLIEALDAERLASFDPAALGLEDRPPEHLLRVDPIGTETSGLAATLDRLGEETDGPFTVSSPTGLALLALAARQRDAGHQVSPNWVGRRSGFTDGESLEDGADELPSNAFDWAPFGRETTQDIDVVTAWQMLERTVDGDSGSDVDLSPGSVKIAILDGGFAPGIGESGMNTLPNDFTPNGFLAPFWTAANPLGFDPIDTESLSTCSGGHECPWHGTLVASAAMAVPDNEFGSAGPAGPIAEPLFLFTEVDRFSMLLSFEEAVARDARVINMSYSIWGPRFWAKSQGLRGALDAYTRSLRSQGILAFTSMPNNGRDYSSAPVRTFHVAPCHNDAVICVNGLKWNSRQRDSDSAYGRGADIAAPFTLWLSPTPDSSGPQWGSGNSFASPFAAGVAALVMHANPDLSVDEVEEILMDTAHDSPDSTIPRYVNAAGAVREALVRRGYEPIRIEISSPEDGETVSRGTGINLVADALDLDDGTPDVEWRIEDGEVLGTGRTVTLAPDAFETAGEYTLVAEATGENGTVSDQVSISVVDDPPSMEITNPGAGAVFTEDEAIILSGTSYSSGELGPLPDSAVAWYLDDASSALGTGHEVTVDASTVALGTHDIRFVGTAGAVTGEDQVSVEIVEAAVDPRPSVRIDSPDNGATFSADQQDSDGEWYVAVTLSGSVSDNMPIDDSDVVWTTSVNGGPEQTLGTGPTVSNARLYAPECFNAHRITLTATDSEGQTRQFSIDVTVSLLC